MSRLERVALMGIVALAAGLLVGSWLGPQVVRRLPEPPLRVAVALGGFALAGWLAVG